MELGTHSHSASALSRLEDSRSRIRNCIEQDGAKLLGTLRLYLSRTDLYRPDDVRIMADDLLSDVVREALEHAAGYDPTRLPLPWLLGIGSNIIKRRIEAKGKLMRGESPMSDLIRQRDRESDDDFLDRVAAVFAPYPVDDLEAQEQSKALLELVSSEDQHVLRLAVLEEYSGEELARALGTSASTARVRLSRALGRLRQAWQRRSEESDANR